jgi:hypothetical protein
MVVLLVYSGTTSSPALALEQCTRASLSWVPCKHINRKSLAYLANKLYSIPTSGGQYYWVAILAPRSSHRYLSYVTGIYPITFYLSLINLSIGWLCATSWQTNLAAASFIAGTTAQGLIALNNPNYVPQNWHGTLLTIAIALVTILFNTILAKRLPIVEGVLVILHLLGIAILVPLWVLSPIREGGDVLTTFYNGGGYSTVGLSAMVGMFPVATSMIGLDCSIHMGKYNPIPPYSSLTTSSRGN